MKETPVQMSNGKAHQARKRFGQNFLHDRDIIERIIATIGASAEDQLLEIGPGQAALTDLLAESGARLDCVELDRDLVKYLKQRFLGNERVTIHQQDVLKFDPRTLRPEPHGLRVVGNLPYNISTPVIFHLLKHHGLIRDMVFMLQLEVIQRMVAGPDDKAYGRLGLMLQYYCQVEHLFNVPSAAFTPRPKVVSAIVRLTPHREMPLTAKDPGCLETVVRTAFNQRRKTLKNSLKPLFSTEAMAQLPIDTSLRPENLSLADYVLVSDKLSELQSQNPEA
jgi:16S rRNA (adenine1518-N6/adenine1519-N6)-dimethyltransferase